MLWEDAGCQNGRHDSARIPDLCYFLRALRTCQATKLIPWAQAHSNFMCRFTYLENTPGNKIDSMGGPHSTIRLRFECFIKCQVIKLIPWERPHSTFILHFTCFEKMPNNNMDFMKAPIFTLYIAFHMLWEAAEKQNWLHGSAHIQPLYCVLHTLRTWQITKLILWRRPESNFILRFTCFEKLLGNRVHFMEVASVQLYIAFYMLWEAAG